MASLRFTIDGEPLTSEPAFNLLQHADRAKREAAAKEIGASPAQVALGWLVQQPAVTSVIIGVRTVEQLDENLKAAELTLSSDEMRKLDEASAYEVGYPYEFIKGVQGRW